MIVKSSFETSPKQPRTTWHHIAAATSQVALWHHECDAQQLLYGAHLECKVPPWAAIRQDNLGKYTSSCDQYTNCGKLMNILFWNFEPSSRMSSRVSMSVHKFHYNIFITMALLWAIIQVSSTPICMVQCTHLITTGGTPHLYIESLACWLTLCMLEKIICNFTNSVQISFIQTLKLIAFPWTIRWC